MTTYTENQLRPILKHYDGTLKPEEQQMAQRLPQAPGFGDGFRYVWGGFSFFFNSKMWKQCGTICVPIGICGAWFLLVTIIIAIIAIVLVIVGVATKVWYVMAGLYPALYVYLIIFSISMSICSMLVAIFMYPLQHFFTLVTEETMKGKDYEFKCFQEFKCPEVIFFFGRMWLYLLVVNALTGIIIWLFYIPGVNIVWGIVFFIIVGPILYSIQVVGMAYNARGGENCDIGYIFSPYSFVFKNFMACWGIGLGLELMNMIPIVNFFAGPAGLVGTTRFLIHYFHIHKAVPVQTGVVVQQPGQQQYVQQPQYQQQQQQPQYQQQPQFVQQSGDNLQPLGGKPVMNNLQQPLIDPSTQLVYADPIVDVNQNQ